MSTDRAIGRLPGHVTAAADTDDVLVTSLMLPVSDLESEIVEQIRYHDLSRAEGGYWLDRIGAEYNERRNGLGDDEYRAQILGEIATRRSTGRHSDVVEVAGRVLDATTGRVFLTDVYPARVDVYIEPAPGYPAPFDADALSRARVKIQRALAAGVGIRTMVVAEHDGFGFSDDTDALGFDEGALSEVVP